MKSLMKIGFFVSVMVCVVSCNLNDNERETNIQNTKSSKSKLTKENNKKEALPNTQHKNTTIQKSQQRESAVAFDKTKQNVKSSGVPKFERPNIKTPGNKSFTLSKDSAKAIMQTRAARKWADQFNEYTKTAKRQPQSAPLMKKVEAKPIKIDEAK